MFFPQRITTKRKLAYKSASKNREEVSNIHGHDCQHPTPVSVEVIHGVDDKTLTVNMQHLQ